MNTWYPFPLNPKREIDRITHVDIGTARAIVDHAVQHLNEPVQPMQGQGVVIAAGGPYLKYAWASVSKLRQIDKSNLHIQLWHMGAGEVSDYDRERFAEHQVEWVDGLPVMEDEAVKHLHPWALKVIAVKRSPFRHVLLLDADCVPLLTPKKLFTSPHYKVNGCLLWPDLNSFMPATAADVIGVPPGKLRDHEAGQLLIDKERNWKELCLASFFASHKFFHDFWHGDKNVWGAAFAKLGTKYTECPRPEWKGWGMLHYTPDLEEAFAHYMATKRDPVAAPEEIQRLIDSYQQAQTEIAA